MRDWLGEARREPYELQLDNGRVVIFADPHTIPGVSPLEFAHADLATALEWLCGDQYDAAWQELRAWPYDEATALLKDCCGHYGLPLDECPELSWLLSDYGDAIEADLHASYGLDVHGFFTGALPMCKLAGLVGLLREQRTSYLNWAMVNDDDLYLRTRDQQPQQRPSKRIPPPETFEWTLVCALLSNLIDLLQQQIHATATHGTKAARKKPKITHYPPPRTAKERVERREARREAAEIDAVIVFAEDLPPEQRPDSYGHITGTDGGG